MVEHASNTPRRRHAKEELSSEAHPGSKEFCTNCDDIENMAVTDEPDHLDQIRNRFRDCDKSGKFQGDICSRLFIADDNLDPDDFFEDEE